ncbi:unnamed protein product [Didymodactylos carnosus]|uniref:Amine oxidase n=1 Tax=Didymodactylos carnosus TaxID=1234261 RepID=A0A814C5G4_9BILA|nr:unnamed protein product [Didymodactylos carnosus]CAF0936304.1 unnamed protein product [Didymodactylos carnosus]CAF3519592.1 unnamed protein product [Didymodactylos carnosus]CAF3713449.1 unnamed protein product [Didymodactylos carnosus]
MSFTAIEHDLAAREHLGPRLSTHPTKIAEEIAVEKNVSTKTEIQFLPVRHPLDPLTSNEIKLATKILRDLSYFQNQMRIVTIVLLEPKDKIYVYNFQPNDEIVRQVIVVIRDPIRHLTLEMIIDLNNKNIRHVQERTDVQPSLISDEMIASDEALRSDKNLLAALEKRNLDINNIVFCPFGAGYRDPSDAPGKRRIFRPLAAVSGGKEDNHYAHPVEGIVITVNLDDMTVEVEDHYVVSVPTHTANYSSEGITSSNNIPWFPNGIRKDLKPLLVIQPDGPSFRVDGYQVMWQKWRFRVGFNVREGLVLHTIEYFDQEHWRSIIYRAAMSEMYVPYGDPNPSHSYKNVSDVGEAGLGLSMNSLVLGCDCLGDIYYFDAIVNNSQGEPILLKNAICMHEEDGGLLWKHTEGCTVRRTEVRRSRRLVISCIATVGNYE